MSGKPSAALIGTDAIDAYKTKLAAAERKSLDELRALRRYAGER